MFDVSASELLVVGAVALIVIGPKELPGVLRMVGQTVGKLKRMAGEFRTQFDDAMREADLHDIKKSVQDTVNTASAATSFSPIETIRNEIRSTVEEAKAATRAAESDALRPAGAAAPEQGPPVMALHPLPDPAPVRLTPDLPTPETPTVLSVPADPVDVSPRQMAGKPRVVHKPRTAAGDEA